MVQAIWIRLMLPRSKTSEGSDHNDRLTGDHRMNTLMGGDGDDTLSGGGEFDVLMGQKGDDTISGGGRLRSPGWRSRRRQAGWWRSEG